MRSIFVLVIVALGCVGTSCQTDIRSSESDQALRSAMFAAVSLSSAEDAERAAIERLDAYREGAQRSREEAEQDVAALDFWVSQRGLGPLEARVAAAEHWAETREEAEDRLRQRAAEYATLAGISVERAVERAVSARNAHLSQFGE